METVLANLSILFMSGGILGKTTTLTARIIKFLFEDCKPVAALTFTRKAAEEMRQRIGASLISIQHTKKFVNTPSCSVSPAQNDRIEDVLYNSKQGVLFVGTIHSFCKLLLKTYGYLIGISSSFRYIGNRVMVISREWQTQIIREILENACSSIKKPCNLESSLENRHDTGNYETSDMLSEDGEDSVNDLSHAFTKNSSEISCKVVDNFNRLIWSIKYNPSLLEKYKTENFLEFQDVSRTQLRLLDALRFEATHGSITIVGDDDQAIYGWRGSSWRNYCNGHKVFLECNWRCTKSILDVALRLIKCIKLHRIPKDLYTLNPLGEKVTLSIQQNPRAEACFLVKKILQLKCELNLRWSDFAILSRTNSALRSVETFVKDSGIFSNAWSQFVEKAGPVDIPLGKKAKIVALPVENSTQKTNNYEFWRKREVLDILAYCRLIVEDSHDISFLRVVNRPSRSLGPKILRDIESYGAQPPPFFQKASPLKEIMNVHLPKMNYSKNMKVKSFADYLLHKAIILIKITYMISYKQKVYDILQYVTERASFFEAAKSLCNDKKDGSGRTTKQLARLEAFITLIEKLNLFSNREVAASEIILEILKAIDYFPFISGKLSKTNEAKQSSTLTDSVVGKSLQPSAKEDERNIPKNSSLEIENAFHFSKKSESIWTLIKFAAMYTPNSLQVASATKELTKVTVENIEICFISFTIGSSTSLFLFGSMLLLIPTGLHCLLCLLKDSSNGLHSFEEKECVRLSTIHQAKGLEWPVVLLARANEGILPLFNQNDSLEKCDSDTMDEERRIAYVAFTRARFRLVISCVLTDGRQGTLQPSRKFDISEIFFNIYLSRKRNGNPAWEIIDSASNMEASFLPSRKSTSSEFKASSVDSFCYNGWDDTCKNSINGVNTHSFPNINHSDGFVSLWSVAFVTLLLLMNILEAVTVSISQVKWFQLNLCSRQHIL
ncbi:UvrD/REP helicase domain-containing protein [Cardiosporidium cionae]|uniref:DNA 3'-5' helicase n=1 Tax=Cardiosporidium cionae TaxID=476202 RepID=A0ABQ7JE15_9APIC|nr:UvrD/REP helicase domain-containing protein [Cardiosporidium cionae]|eukprot:KAF8822221.1 UvrD/REP helicase domain-containing protein [Cardiosporidium cionae]